MVGIVLRLAHNRSPWMHHNITCLHRSMHASALDMQYDKRNRKKSFLMSLLRHPTKRAVSEFFHFLVGVHNVEPTDNNFIAYTRIAKLQYNYINDLRVKRYGSKASNATKFQNFLRQYNFSTEDEFDNLANKTTREAAKLKRMKLEFINFETNEPNISEIVQDILDDYNFIAVTERMDESLVALQMLMNLSTKEILYTHSRGSGTFSNGPPDRPCIYIPPSFLTPTMEEYFQSDEWESVIKADLLLWNAAQASLDLTIESLGKEEFKRNLDALREGLVVAEENCKGRVHTLCSDGGARIPFVNNSCYVWGEGCDHECIGELNV